MQKGKQLKYKEVVEKFNNNKNSLKLLPFFYNLIQVLKGKDKIVFYKGYKISFASNLGISEGEYINQMKKLTFIVPDKESLKAKYSSSIVIVRKGKILGNISIDEIDTTNTTDEGKKVCSMGTLFVDDSLKGQGLGSMLIELATAYAMEKYYKILSLTFNSKVVAKRKKLGFTEINPKSVYWNANPFSVEKKYLEKAAQVYIESSGKKYTGETLNKFLEDIKYLVWTKTR